MGSDVSVGVVAKVSDERAADLAERLVTALERDGVDASVDESTASALDRNGVAMEALGACDLVVSVGGDGTFLSVARAAGDAPILGVNLGEVGFLNAVAPGDAVNAVSEAVDRLRATGSVDEGRLDRVVASGDGWRLGPALNEVTIQGPRRGPAGGGSFEVRVDGETYASSVADGVLVSTPTGSTAYNLSEGGPLVRPTVDALLVTFMCPVDDAPPLAVDFEAEIEIRVDEVEALGEEGGAFGEEVEMRGDDPETLGNHPETRGEELGERDEDGADERVAAGGGSAGADETATAVADGREKRPVSPPETVTVRVADDPVRLAGPRSEFFRALDKLR